MPQTNPVPHETSSDLHRGEFVHTGIKVLILYSPICGLDPVKLLFRGKYLCE